MDRQWQRDARGRYQTLLSLDAFIAQLPPWPTLARDAAPGVGIASTSPSDVYAVYSVLHAQARNPEVRASASGCFWYLLADLPQEAQQGGKLKQASEKARATSAAIREAVVPVSVRGGGVTLPALHALYPHISEGGDGHLLLALVDASGAASLVRVFSYLQPPFEGPEALPQQRDAEADSDEDGA